MLQTVIAYLEVNYIAILALFISLISFCLNYLGLMDKRRSEVYQLISESFTKASVSRNQFRSILANYELTLTTLRAFGEGEYPYSYIEQIQANKLSIEKSLNNLEILSGELIKIQKGNNSSRKLTLLHTTKFKLLTIDIETSKAEASALEVLRLIESFKKHEIVTLNHLANAGK